MSLYPVKSASALTAEWPGSFVDTTHRMLKRQLICGQTYRPRRQLQKCQVCSRYSGEGRKVHAASIESGEPVTV